MTLYIFCCIVIIACQDFGHGHETYRFDKEINNIAIGRNKLYVATDNCIYQMNFSLHCEVKRKVSGVKDPNRIKLLVVYEENSTLIACGSSTECGGCEVLDLNNISKTIYFENVTIVPIYPDKSALGFLIKTKSKITYLTVGAVHGDETDCKYEKHLITLRNMKDGGEGIFSYIGSSSSPYIKLTEKNEKATVLHVDFVDGFQFQNSIYVIMNLKTNSERVRILWMKNEDDKQKSLESLRGATLLCCEDKNRTVLLSSSLINRGPPVLLAGVFTARSSNPDNTALAIFNITPWTNVDSDKDEDLCSSECTEKTVQSHHIKELKTAFLHPNMTSVATATVNSWIVLFIGTGDGQLLKIVLDKNLNSGCPDILYQFPGDNAVFSKMILDPVDKKQVYIALEKQLSRIRVANCSRFDALRTCWAGQDPYCGWCASESRCTFHDECSNSAWITIPEEPFENLKQMISYQLNDYTLANKEGITLDVMVHLNVASLQNTSFACVFMYGDNVSLCENSNLNPVFLGCSCSFPKNRLVPEGLNVKVSIRINSVNIVENWTLKKCSEIGRTSTTPNRCAVCIAAGCYWSLKDNLCSSSPDSSYVSQTQNTCPKENTSSLVPEIHLIEPTEISYLGKNKVTIKGTNLSQVSKIWITGSADCRPIEIPVLSSTDNEVQFSIPKSTKGVRKVCVVVNDGICHGSVLIQYRSLPSCDRLSPNSTWASGKRRVSILGNNLHFVDVIKHENMGNIKNFSQTENNISYYVPAREVEKPVEIPIKMVVANHTLECLNITYHPDPKFLEFSTTPVANNLQITIKKMKDALTIKTDELNITAIDDQRHPCTSIKIIFNDNSGDDSILCTINNKPKLSIQKIEIQLGDFKEVLEKSFNYYWLLFIVVCIMPFVILAMFCFNRVKQRQLTKKLSEQVELLECDIRNEIREGFAELQTEKSDLLEAFGTIPYLDYKHFAVRTFFPEAMPALSSIVNDVGQDMEKGKQNESSQALSNLIHEQLFLITLVHTLEEQKKFTIKDKCVFASLLTIALHSDLVYLTRVMEVLLRALMDQSSNTQPKLMLRRTESIVEKLLTNWMSICLYGFLRESVGEPLFLMVSALTQRINKGPVDAITEKALYTLNEDWLLWQAHDFHTLKLKVLFQALPDGEKEAGATLEVSVLDCDTTEQAKEKILRSFKSKFGYPYHVQLKDIDIEYEKEGSVLKLQEVDSTSKVGENGVKRLNTIGHYQLSDGDSVRVTKKIARATLSTQESIKDDDNYSTKYCHLIEADGPEIDDLQKGNPQRKKLKLKEVYLTKLLSSKVAVHSFVENLFKTIWGLPNGKAPLAVKYFFDFLDAQAENKKITDPDVLHIWKTNSLPLRFWVNILKNPQFVFDMEKTAHLDSCLSVIAQAFMDSFSLAEQQLGKHAPTNKLLYAKDIPQYKEEVKAYYKQIHDQPLLGFSEFTLFLEEESKKHENEFNESAALHEIYKYIFQYFDEIKLKLEQSGAPSDLKQQLSHVKDVFDGRKMWKWE
ncbi:plexin-C1 [Lepisosteus oculatus]|uniref:plexin-C1 n=1 Tax=Lepisosteus oculatus TaxID=7918 RepID=UPI0037113F72